MPFSLPFVNGWGVSGVCGGWGTVEEGAYKHSCGLITAFWKIKNFNDDKSAKNYDIKTLNEAAARPVNWSSNQPLCWPIEASGLIYGVVASYPLSLLKSFEYTLLCMQVLNPVYYLTGSASGQNEAIPVFWLTTRGGKVGPSFPIRISRSSPTRKRFLGCIINPSLTKIVRLRWLDIGLVFYVCVFIDLKFASVHKKGKKINLGFWGTAHLPLP